MRHLDSPWLRPLRPRTRRLAKLSSRLCLGTCLSLALLLGCLPCLAEVIHLRDGRTLEGCLIGVTDKALTVLTPEGEQVLLLTEVARIDASKPSDPRLEKKAQRARVLFAKERQREARQLLRRCGRATPTERLALEARLQAFPPALLLGPLRKALEDSRPVTRQVALAHLTRLPLPQAVDALLAAALTHTRHDLRQGAHTAALKRDAERSRGVYEAVALSQTKPLRRLRALGRLAELGQRSSVPALIGVLERVGLELRASLAKGRITSVPVDLGTIGQAALRVPIELPEMDLLEVSTKVSVSSLRQIRAAAQGSLGSITQRDLGAEAGPWKAWWSQQSER